MQYLIVFELEEINLSMRKQLDPDADFVESPTFERTFVKVKNDQVGNGPSRRNI